jgi:hypothetical protein
MGFKKHNFIRWTVHKQSQEFESATQRVRVDSMANILQAATEEDTDLRFFKFAFEQLMLGRNALKHSYICKYFLRTSKAVSDEKQAQFELLQGRLETAVERLSYVQELSLPGGGDSNATLLQLAFVLWRQRHHLLSFALQVQHHLACLLDCLRTGGSNSAGHATGAYSSMALASNQSFSSREIRNADPLSRRLGLPRFVAAALLRSCGHNEAEVVAEFARSPAEALQRARIRGPLDSLVQLPDGGNGSCSMVQFTDPPVLIPDGGIFFPGQDFVVHAVLQGNNQVGLGEERDSVDGSTAIYYTFDGTEPTRNSLRIANDSGIPGHILMKYCQRSLSAGSDRSCRLKAVAIAKGRSPSLVTCSAVFWFPEAKAELPVLQ